MKKFITLLIALGTFVAVHAQSRYEARRTILGAPRYTRVYHQPPRVVVVTGRPGYYRSAREERLWREQQRREWRWRHRHDRW